MFQFLTGGVPSDAPRFPNYSMVVLPGPIPGSAAKMFGPINLGAETKDVYTAPAGKRALIPFIYVYNGTAGSITFKARYKLGGVYYDTFSNGSAITSTLTTSTNLSVIACVFVLEPGETLALVGGTAGLNVWGKVIEFPSSFPIFSPRLLAMANGDNTVYTVPSGKMAHVFGAGLGPNSAAALNTINLSGATRNLRCAATAPGVVASSADAWCGNLQTIADQAGGAGTMPLPPFLAAGQSIVLNSDGAGSLFASTTLIELHA